MYLLVRVSNSNGRAMQEHLGMTCELKLPSYDVERSIYYYLLVYCI